MARFQINLDGETYYIDTDLERRVQALEALLQNQSEEVKTNLEVSKAFFVELETQQARLAALEEKAEETLTQEGETVTPEALESKIQSLLLEENKNE